MAQSKGQTGGEEPEDQLTVPEKTALRPVWSEVGAPTTGRLTAAEMIAATTAAVPLAKKNGNRGTIAPKGKRTKEEPPARCWPPS
jgi:hypothetical protein